MKLDDVIALITGGGTGIGLATARKLREAGAKVAVAGRRIEPLERAAKEFDLFPVQGDVGNPKDADRMVRAVVEEFGDYNTLVNNAGWGRFGTLDQLTLEDFRAVMETNVFGAMLMAQASARHFVTKRRGNIINISSTAGSRGFAGGTAYVASKFALGGMTECWRAELRQHDIRVMQINPSEVLTDFASTAGYDQKSSERKLHAEDIAHAIVGVLSMHDRGFTTDLTVFATNPD